MKKLDKLILTSFIGPFILTFLVVVFILLTQHMLKYFDDIIGKGLGMDVIGQLLFYFAIFMTPIAMPLAVLLSALIAFGNLGEHFELTAIKSAGISLVRTLVPIFFFVVCLTVLAFYINNNLVPKAALEAYSLLYDIKQKKPALDLREGAFYDGIPNMNIKVNEKFPDGITIKGIIIYDHRKHDGNRDVTVADSGKMYTIFNERYLKLELFNGYNYTEGSSAEQDLAGRSKYGSNVNQTLSRTMFEKTQVVFDLSSFQLSRTDKKWFQGNRIMRNLRELDSDIDSIDREMMIAKVGHYHNQRSYFSYYKLIDSLVAPKDVLEYKSQRDSLLTFPVAESVMPTPIPIDTIAKLEKKQSADTATALVAKIYKDTLDEDRLLNKARRKRKAEFLKKESITKQQAETAQPTKPEASGKQLSSTSLTAIADSVLSLPTEKGLVENAASKARGAKNQVTNTQDNFKEFQTDRKVFLIQWHKIIASSLACIVMFLIGAPLGAIIKKGGLGVPFLVSILFFIIYYLLTMTGEKWAKQGLIPVPVGVWAADVILFIVGLLFLRQARLDARLFEADFYLVVFDKAKNWLIQKGILPTSQT